MPTPPTTRTDLLRCATLSEFLRTLRGDRSCREVMEMLRPYGGPTTSQAVTAYEARGSVSSVIQMAYVRAFQLDEEARLRLQELAGSRARVCA